MNSDDVNDRKRKLNNIIKKITETQLLKIKEADNSACSRQDCKFTMNPQERDKETNKEMSIKLLNEKELSHFEAPVKGFTAAVAGSSEELPATLPEPVGSDVALTDDGAQHASWPLQLH